MNEETPRGRSGCPVLSCPHLAKPHLAKTAFGQKNPNLARSFSCPHLAKTQLARISVSKFWPHLAKPHLANFGVLCVLAMCVFSRFWVCSRLCCVCVWCVLCWVSSVVCVVCVVFLVGVFKIFGGCRTPSLPSAGAPPPQDRPPPNRPKFRSFFSLSRRKFHSFFSLWGVFSLNFGGVFEGRDPQMCTFRVLWLSCEAPAAPKPLGHTGCFVG